MRKAITESIDIVILLVLVSVFALPLTSHAISRIDSRTQAADMRTAGVEQDGSSGGTGGSNGGQSGGNSDTSESTDVNVNQDAAQELFDDSGFNDLDSNDPPIDGNLDTGDTEDQVTNADTQNPGYGFLDIFHTIFARFRSN